MAEGLIKCTVRFHPTSPPQCSNVAAQVLKSYLRSNRCRPSLRTWNAARQHSSQAVVREAKQASRDESIPAKTGKSNLLSQRAKQRHANKEFFQDLLSSAATKRDAKAYISRLKHNERSRSLPADVQAGDVFGRTTRAVDASPVFTQYLREPDALTDGSEDVHVALIKTSNVSVMSEAIVEGMAQTLSSLSRLSMVPCVILEEHDASDAKQKHEKLRRAAEKLEAAIGAVHDAGARVVDNLFSLGDDGHPQIFLRKLLMRPINRGQIPIIMPLAYAAEASSTRAITADQALLALSRDSPGRPHEAGVVPQISVDRVIVVDESGPIPSTKSIDNRHVFVNLAQEYSSLQEELRSSTNSIVSKKHASNLRLFRDALQVLPPSASGLLTTPFEVANSGRSEKSGVTSVGTRRQKNPLIHNLLTDKPASSSSLPMRRLGPDSTSSSLIMSTFIKRGMPVTTLPNPDAQPWTASSTPRILLTDPRIDLARLTHLIDDSFNRQLDVEAYLERVNDRIAGVIIAGDYEGGAILTWETPPNCSDTDQDRLVPYLDKFAVLKRSQGAGGVADIVFNAMVRTAFPTGVCWRSRKDNPVNKWYFERSRGTWKIPQTNWTMFWTTPGIFEEDVKSQTFLDYEGVCRTVMPTWADKKQIVD
jgi:amino-acid N-acetyltransferase